MLPSVRSVGESRCAGWGLSPVAIVQTASHRGSRRTTSAPNYATCRVIQRCHVCCKAARPCVVPSSPSLSWSPVSARSCSTCRCRSPAPRRPPAIPGHGRERTRGRWRPREASLASPLQREATLRARRHPPRVHRQAPRAGECLGARHPAMRWAVNASPIKPAGWPGPIHGGVRDGAADSTAIRRCGRLHERLLPWADWLS